MVYTVSSRSEIRRLETLLTKAKSLTMWVGVVVETDSWGKARIGSQLSAGRH